MLRSYVDYRPFECWTFGSECDGGFAQYAIAPARETYAVDCDWSDIELAALRAPIPPPRTCCIAPQSDPSAC